MTEELQISITVILKEYRGCDRAFQLMYLPCPMWTENERELPIKRDPEVFSLKGQFKELLDYCKNNGHGVSEKNECIIMYRKEVRPEFTHYAVDIKGLFNDIEANGFTYQIIEY